MKVFKFGGAALKDAASIQHVARVTLEEGADVVVCSAMQGVTDQILQALPGLDEPSAQALMAQLRTRHEEAANVLGASVGDLLQALERLLYGIAYTGECTPRSRDAVAAFGERLSSQMVAAAIVQAGGNARALDAAQAGIRTLGPHGNARPDLAAIARLVPEALQGDGIPVVTGFFGVDQEGHPTIFGRGGSDYVASLLAFGATASEVHLWKDVSGFLSGDPSMVPDARLVPRLGYDEAAELANFGARVLHPRCVEPIEALGIPIHVRSIQDPKAQGSIIDAHAEPAPTMVRACAVKADLAILKLNGPGMAYTSGIGRRVFEALGSINVLNMSTSQATFALTIDMADLAAAQAALAPLVGGVIQSVEAIEDRSLVCVVGRGLGETPGSAAKILAAVSDAKVNVELISLGASQYAIDFIVHNDAARAAVRSIHHAFLESP